MIKRILAAVLGAILLFSALFVAALSALAIYEQYWQLPQLAARMGTTVVSKHGPAEVAKLVVAWLFLIAIGFLSVKLLLYSGRNQPSTKL